MTIQKALEMIQNLHNCELQTQKIFKGNDSLENKIHLIAKGKADYLENILSELDPETFPCEHPNKLHDVDPDGNLYCMGCNQNL